MEAVEFKRFDDIGTEVDFQTIKSRFWDAARIELFSESKIVKLNIRFDEVYHECTESEWKELRKFIESNRVPFRTNRWWQFWDR